MDIRNRTELKETAARRLADFPQHKRISAIYGGLVTGLSLLAVVMSYVLGLQIDQSGGLSNLGTRTILSTLQTMLNPLLSILLTCLELGFLSTMLRVSRSQYASPNGLRLGFDRFWVLMRTLIFQSLIFCGIGLACIYLATNIYLMTPFADPVMAILEEVMADATAGAPLVMDTALYERLSSALTPLLVIISILYLAVATPLIYSYRMVNFLIIDKPGMGALAALQMSRYIMKYNRLDMLKLDLSLWPYYAGTLVAVLVSYGDSFLAMAGIQIPGDPLIPYFGFYIAYLVLQFAVFYFLRPKAEVTYALAYDRLRPEDPKQDGGVVLGNIFQM